MIEHKGTQQLQTMRLQLRRFIMADAPQVYRNWAKDPDVSKFLTWEPHRSEKDAEAFLRSLDYQKNHVYEWAIVLKETGSVIGSISVVKIDENAKIAALGYCIGKAYWNQGYMSEAVREVTSYLFRLGFHRIEIDNAEKNPASGAVAKKCGFTYEGKSRAGFFRHGEYLDICHWARLREDL